MQRCVECPGNRPCAACERPMTVNARFCFAKRRVQCLCLECWRLGFVFTPDGEVVLLCLAAEYGR